MKYKALISDVDGTLVPNSRHGELSQKVIDAVAKAKDLIHVGVATARPYRIAYPVINRLKLSGPSILHGGAQIINISTGTIYRQHQFENEDIQKIYEITKVHKEKLFIDEKVESYLEADDYSFDTPILGSYIPAVSDEKADILIKELSKIPAISVVKCPSWVLGKIDVSVGPLQATKQHGILEVAEILNIYPHEIIAIGDGQNDFAMLMAAGLKVAIGNAVQELKEIADYIAPSVDDDGVAWVIEKFVLNQ